MLLVLKPSRVDYYRDWIYKLGNDGACQQCKPWKQKNLEYIFSISKQN